MIGDYSIDLAWPDIYLAVVVGEDTERDERPAANNWAVVLPQEQQVRAAFSLSTVEVG
jgi:hypothetical protein